VDIEGNEIMADNDFGERLVPDSVSGVRHLNTVLSQCVRPRCVSLLVRYDTFHDGSCLAISDRYLQGVGVIQSVEYLVEALEM
jgi:hypothetical protein